MWKLLRTNCWTERRKEWQFNVLAIYSKLFIFNLYFTKKQRESFDAEGIQIFVPNKETQKTDIATVTEKCTNGTSLKYRSNYIYTQIPLISNYEIVR